MVEIKEVLLLWMGGAKKKRIAAQLSLDVKTVRRYIAAGESTGLVVGAGELTDEQVGAVVLALQPSVERAHGDGWQKCESERAEIKRLLEQEVRLSKVRRLMHRRGIEVPYSRRIGSPSPSSTSGAMRRRSLLLTASRARRSISTPGG